MKRLQNIRQLIGSRLGKDNQKLHESQSRLNQISFLPLDNSAFPYEPLDPDITAHFRLVQLEPAGFGQHSETSPPHCSLVSAVWSSKDTSYEALSYVWGNIRKTKTISLDDTTFAVTENLYSALIHLRYSDKPRLMWIDAICIDQNNVEERNHQVGSMGQIYSNCDRVIVWLGEKDGESDATLDFIRSMSEELSKEWHFMPTIRAIWDHTLSVALLGELFNSGTASRWMAVCRLLERPWWKRAWIFQEFVRAPDALFYIGESIIRWEKIYYMIKIMYSAPDMRSLLKTEISDPAATLTDANDMIYARLQNSSRVVGSKSQILPSRSPAERTDFSYFCYLLNCQRSRGCGDLRDKVYSILNMADSEVTGALSPNYSESVRWTYILAIKVHIKVYMNLDILSYSMHGTQSSDYPSWCSDWGQPENRSSLQSVLYDASGGRSAHAKFSKDDCVLALKGVRIDVVRDACIQSSSQGFSWKSTPGGLKCSWDLGSMANKVKEGKSLLIGSNIDAQLTSTFEDSEEDKSIYEELTHTLVAGYYTTSSSRTIDPPHLYQDHLTEEWWPDDRPAFCRQMYARTWGRTVILTKHNHLGLAPLGTREGDEIWVLYGCRTPVVLRNEGEGLCVWVGNTYVHGAMGGEAVEDMEGGYFKEETVMIR